MLGTARRPLPGTQTAASDQLCSMTSGKSLLSEPWLLPQLNGYNVHEAFVTIVYDNEPKKLSTGPDLAKGQKRTFTIIPYPHSPSTKPLYK